MHCTNTSYWITNKHKRTTYILDIFIYRQSGKSLLNIMYYLDIDMCVDRKREREENNERKRERRKERGKRGREQKGKQSRMDW